MTAMPAGASSLCCSWLVLDWLVRRHPILSSSTHAEAIAFPDVSGDDAVLAVAPLRGERHIDGKDVSGMRARGRTCPKICNHYCPNVFHNKINWLGDSVGSVV